MTPLFCPHCSSELSDHDFRSGGRCASCRLVVGPGRARSEPPTEPSSGGFLANAARREDAAPVERETIFAALRAVAGSNGCKVERIRMIDYDHAVKAGHDGPTVGEILATFDSWKAARSAARLPEHVASERAAVADVEAA